MRIPTFGASVLGGGLSRMGIGALPFLLAMLLQLVFGLNPFASGLMTFTSADRRADDEVHGRRRSSAASAFARCSSATAILSGLS